MQLYCLANPEAVSSLLFCTSAVEILHSLAISPGWGVKIAGDFFDLRTLIFWAIQFNASASRISGTSLFSTSPWTSLTVSFAVPIPGPKARACLSCNSVKISSKQFVDKYPCSLSGRG